MRAPNRCCVALLAVTFQIRRIEVGVPFVVMLHNSAPSITHGDSLGQPGLAVRRWATPAGVLVGQVGE
eukprot:3062864-Alexandrium_andersonii.AAC.1